MHERALRNVLLIHAVEESDRTGELLPLADRAEATRVIARTQPPSSEKSGARFLALRAERLCEQLYARMPVVREVMALAKGATWASRAVFVLAFLLGVSLSALDGSRRINILAFPLVGLIAWNLLVYVALLLSWMRQRASGLTAPPWAATWYERWIRWRIEALQKRSSKFSTPLAAALRRFAVDWGTLAYPLLFERAKRLLHYGAALVAAGLIAGLYVRGVGFQYEAGWESTFLRPETVHTLITLLYAPASAISGVPLPTVEAIGGMRWFGVSGGVEAAPWIHLIAWTALLYVVFPRLLAALVATFKQWNLSRRLEVPAALAGYTRSVIAGAGGTVTDTAYVTPYAYEPARESLAGLEKLLPSSIGGAVRVEVRDPLRYGEEDRLTERVARSADGGHWNVLLMNLAATPEAENHGAVITLLRDAQMKTGSAPPLLVVIDEAPYAARMQGDASLDARLQERRQAWRQFVSGYGLKASVIDLSRITVDGGSEAAARETLRATL